MMDPVVLKSLSPKTIPKNRGTKLFTLSNITSPPKTLVTALPTTSAASRDLLRRAPPSDKPRREYSPMLQYEKSGANQRGFALISGVILPRWGATDLTDGRTSSDIAPAESRSSSGDAAGSTWSRPVLWRRRRNMQMRFGETTCAAATVLRARGRGEIRVFVFASRTHLHTRPVKVETLVGGPRVIGHRRSTQCNSAGRRHPIFEKMESIKKDMRQGRRPSFVLCSVDRACMPRSAVFTRSSALWFRPARLGWRHNNDRPFVAYSTERIFEAQLERHQTLATVSHPFEDLCSGFDTDSERPDEDVEEGEEEPRSLSPSVSDRSIFTDDGQLTTVATDVDDHCSVVSSSFVDGWVSSHEEGDEEDDDESSTSSSRTKFFIPRLGDVEDASSSEGDAEEPKKQHIDADLARLMINSSYNIPGFTLPMVATASKSCSDVIISASKSCPSVGGESGYLSCESVSPPPSGDAAASAESKRDAPPTPLPPPTDPFHNGQYEISTMDVLSEKIWYFHKEITQTPQTLGRKMELRNHLYSIIRGSFAMSGLYIVGSSLNGFGNNTSDMDLCLMITNDEIDQRTDAVVILNHVMNCLVQSPLIRENGLKLIIAKVPILRIKFTAPYADITVDLNANNAVAIKNTHLLSHYSNFDWRLCPLVSVIKEWAKRRGMNDANKSSFTSYSLVLMVIHYLQCGVEKPTLPSLQKMYPKRFSEKNDVRTLKMQIQKPFEFPPPEKWEYDYSASLCDLLLGFLRYYAYEFDFNVDAISVRLGQRTNRAFVAQNSCPYALSQWRCICIEEPFTLSNTAHSIYDEVIFHAIKGAFRSGYEELDMNRDLEAFLNMPPIKIPLANTRGQQYGNFVVETNYTPMEHAEKSVDVENGAPSNENAAVLDRRQSKEPIDLDQFPPIRASEDAQKHPPQKNRKGARGTRK
uniref:PAP-associated domain-containing protein n=1 Tax=Steinernema glaseri TaxID=37863 RepID=A0A1I7YRG5_9BILA